MGLIDALRQLATDHRNFVRLLDILGAELAKVRAQTRGDYELMRDIMHYMTRYPDLIHHPTENLLTDALVKHHRGFAGRADKLAKEHAALARQGEQFYADIAQVVDGALASREALVSSGEAYVTAQRQHIAWEDAFLFPELEKTLDDADAAEVSRTLRYDADPLFGPVLQKEYRGLQQHIERQAPPSTGDG